MDRSLRRLGRRRLLLAGACAAGIAMAVSYPAAAENQGFGNQNQQWYLQTPSQANHGANGRDDNSQF